MKRRWTPSPLLLGSAALHLGAAAAFIARHELWPWAVGAIVANHIVLAAVGLWPRSQWLGQNWTRLPPPAAARGAIAITIDDGPDPDITPRVLDLLDRYGAKVTFFCIGERLARHPELARDILARGHAVENHSLSHRHNFSLLGPRGLRREVGAAQACILKTAGAPALFFRAPAGLRNPFLDYVLSEYDLTLASWTRRGFDTVNGNPASILAKLTRGLRAGDILLLHDGHAALTPEGDAVILQALAPLLEAIAAAGLVPVTLRSALP
jgi:peptidoglycan-N-acetylglucosamine deacetylase